MIGKCLWDVFSNNHEVIAADGRLVDIGSFRGASAFLDEYLGGPQGQLDCGDEYRFYMGSVWISRRADLTPAYKMIFRRLKTLGADWNCHFPQLYLVDLSPLQRVTEKQDGTYSPREAFANKEQDKHRTDLQKAREELKSIENEARREAMNEGPPKTVRAYQEVYRRDAKGWPPIKGQARVED